MTDMSHSNKNTGAAYNSYGGRTMNGWIFNERNLFASFFTLCVLAAALMMVPACTGQKTAEDLHAGFARVCITPPVGSPMTGFGARDYDPVGSRGTHDDLYVRALSLSQGNEQVIIMGFDLLFFSRDEADRFKGAIGRRLGIEPNRILLNTSHTHTGPKVGTWFYTDSDQIYLDFLEGAIVDAAVKAQENSQPVTMWAGATTSKVPMSRRKPLPDGSIDFAPYPDGTVCNTLPVCLFRDADDMPVCLLFSVSCHPSTIKGDDRAYQMSADYPGAAMAALDDYLGTTVSMFLQGAGGDAKASVIGEGSDNWRAGTWDDVDKAGRLAADEVISVLNDGLVRREADLGNILVEMDWPLQDPPSKADLEEIIANPSAHSESMPEVKQTWAREQLTKLSRGYTLRRSVPITAHAVQLAPDVRIVGIEGELVAGLGNIIVDHYDGGVTFPLGYTDGAQLYLPTSEMMDEGGYEVASYWEYRQPAPLKKGMENILTATLDDFDVAGIR